MTKRKSRSPRVVAPKPRKPVTKPVALRIASALVPLPTRDYGHDSIKFPPRFDVGDVVNVNSYTSGYEGKGQIVALRHAVGNTRNGDLSAGADVLLSNGKVIFFFLHDIARWNSEKCAQIMESNNGNTTDK